LIAMLAWQGYRLFRKAMRTFDALGRLADKADILAERVEELEDEVFRSTVFDDAAEHRDAWYRLRYARAIRRQQRKEARIQRARLLVRADPRRFAYLLKRT
jgi:flagellar biosynthesis/type III secretory pathway M-ring protein FliF/YscJ